MTDVFILSHGWQGDYDDAIRQYDRWIGAANPDSAGDSIRPFIIGVHWPSKAWSDRELKSAPSGLLGDEPADDPDAVTVDAAVDEYAAELGDSPEVRAALKTVLDYAAELDPDQDATGDDELPTDVADAYRVLAAATGANEGDDSLLGGGWDPDDVFVEAAQEQEDDGLLGEGWFQKLREAVLTPLRQLTFWHGKNQAREFGERGAAKLVRAVMAASPARVHLMGHSFGTIVVSSAVRGPGRDPVAPPRPVDSLYLVQGAVSLWAFSAHVPRQRRRRTRISRGCRHAGVRVRTHRRDSLEVGLRRRQVLSARRGYRASVPARRRPAEVRRHRHVRDPGRAGAVELPRAAARVTGPTSTSRRRPSTTSTPAPSSRRWRERRARTTTSPTASSSWLGWNAALSGVTR